MMLCGAEPRKILQILIDEKTPAIMSYSSKGKWHVAKVLMTNLGANRFNIEVSPRKKPHPINIQVNQAVGISLKYGYGKFIFETKVAALEPSSKSTAGGTISLEIPGRIDLVPRRSYFRVEIPKALKVNAQLWHRYCAEDLSQTPPEQCWQGRLVDISASGAQVAVDVEQRPDFKKGQFIGLRFTPMPYETPLMFNAVIRTILPTADEKSICLGMQLVGLEASPEGRQILQRLCSVVEQYYQINKSNAKQQDFQTTKLTSECGL
jgi:hypothetical protein